MWLINFDYAIFFWRIAEKDKQIKQTEDSLASEHDHLTSKEEELKVSNSYIAAVFWRAQHWITMSNQCEFVWKMENTLELFEKCLSLF